MTAVLTLAAGLSIALVAWRWAARGIDGAARVALVCVLGTTAASFNVVVPIPSVEATTTVVLCTAMVLGARTGIATGLVAVVGSSVAGGVGAWTVWQVVAVTTVALLAAGAGRLTPWGADWSSRRRVGALALLAVVATVLWDVIVTAGSIASYAPQAGLEPLEQIAAALLLGAAFTAVHVACSTALTVVGGPPLLHALERARPRLAGGTIVPARG